MHPRKRFGQNFLRDQTVIDRIVAAINPTPQGTFVEIGPGQGALTQKVLPLCQHLIAIELDRDLIAPLQQRCQGLGELSIHQADALKFDFSQLYVDGKRLTVFGNLPYNISSPLLFHLLDYSQTIDHIIFMLQYEVVARMAAEPGTKAYGRLSVMIQYHCAVEPLFDVAPEAFYPAPKVNSTVVRLTPHRPLPFPVTDRTVFQNVVRSAFQQRRKTLANALKDHISPTDLVKIEIDPQLRPDQISLQNYVKIANLLYSNEPASSEARPGR